MNTTEDSTHVKYEFLESPSVGITIIFCHIIIISSSIVGMAANSLILYCIKRQKSLRTYANATLINSCIINILGCSFLLPFRFIVLGMFIDEPFILSGFCKTVTFFRSFCEIFQLSMLVTISYERYHAVLLPFEKESRVKRVVTLIVLSWCLAIIYSTMSTVFLLDSSIYIICKQGQPHLDRNWVNYDSFVSFPFGCLCFISVLIFYTCIIKALLKQSKKMLSHSKVRNRKVHPAESNVHMTSSVDALKTPAHTNVPKTDVITTQNVTNTQSVPEISINELHVGNGNTKDMKDALQINDNESMLKPSILFNKLPSINETSSSGQNLRSKSLVVISSSSEMQNINLSPAREKVDKPKDGNINISNCSDKMNEEKTYEIYDADGTIRVEKNSNDQVVGDVCVFNPKNREIGKRKLEAKIAKHFAIGIGLFGLVWIPFPVFILIHFNTIMLSEAECHVLAVLSTFSLTVYTVNPLITIFMNGKVNAECKKISKHFCKK